MTYGTFMDAYLWVCCYSGIVFLMFSVIYLIDCQIYPEFRLIMSFHAVRNAVLSVRHRQGI